MRSKSTSTSTSSKIREAAVRAAALQAELEAQKEEAEHEEELERLELEEAKRRSELEAEEKTRRAEADIQIEKRRRALEQRRVEKQLRIEQAKLRVYEDEEIVIKSSLRSLNVNKGANTKPDTASHKSSTLAETNKSTSMSMHQMNPEATTWSPSAPKNDLTEITQALAASVSLSRLPMPEPPVFNGDPLGYPDWEASFSALIESRGIPAQERIHYLKKYLGGPAREAVSGHFLLKSDNAYEAAKRVLQERYGSSFAITQAFRDKLDDWPRVNKRDGKDLRRFSDFL